MSRTISFDDNPPRPRDGAGDVVVKVGNMDVVLTWENNNITKISALEENGSFLPEDMTINDLSLGVVSCKKCATDSDTGKTVCWPVPC